MGKLVVLAFVSLDGVMQAPGGPTEDTDGGFTLGGWTVPYFDEALGQVMGEQMSGEYNLLLGRRTFEIFATYWPEHEDEWPGINAKRKYVASRTLTHHPWQATTFLNSDVAAEVRAIKESDGPDLQVHGSATLIQTLLANDLVDELWLKIFPVVLGPGKRLFGEGTIPRSFTLVGTQVAPSGVIVATYARAGDVVTGAFGA